MKNIFTPKANAKIDHMISESDIIILQLTAIKIIEKLKYEIREGGLGLVANVTFCKCDVCKMVNFIFLNCFNIL